MHEQTRYLARIAMLRLAPLLCAVLLAWFAADAHAVNRCEDRNGRVTYTDEPCPAGARNVRRVDDSAPVQVRDSSGRPAAEAKDETAETKVDAAKSPRTNADKAPPAAGAAGGELRPGRIVASSTPEQEIQRLDEARARQRRQCAELTRKVDYARADLQAASGGDRASAELTLRRLQQEAREVCPR